MSLLPLCCITWLCTGCVHSRCVKGLSTLSRLLCTYLSPSFSLAFPVSLALSLCLTFYLSFSMSLPFSFSMSLSLFLPFSLPPPSHPPPLLKSFHDEWQGTIIAFKMPWKRDMSPVCVFFLSKALMTEKSLTLFFKHRLSHTRAIYTIMFFTN